MTKRDESTGKLAKIYLAILFTIFGGIVVHAPLSVWLGSIFPEYELVIKSWKEILMLVACLLLAWLIYRRKRGDILKDPLVIGIGAYGLLHLATLPVFFQGTLPALAGLVIDLRYLLFFLLVYVGVKLYPTSAKSFLKVCVAGALVVVSFALLQIFILPIDVLSQVGYGTNTIAPYLTIDQSNFIRISSSLRGPNPLGAYLVIILSALVAWVITRKVAFNHQKIFIFSVLLWAGLTTLWHSYSRSALIAMVIALAALLFIRLRGAGRKYLGFIFVGLFAVASLLVFIYRDSYVVANILLHKNPESSVVTSSNEQHLESIEEGIEGVVENPIGTGIGSVGSASILGDKPYIIENQYIYIAHEVGWLGVAMFGLIFIGIMKRLWQRRRDWLALSLFASGIGMAIIGVLLPVWTDDTVAIIWWGLTAIAVGGSGYGNSINKKTA